jgi:hypothetical protein
MALNLKESPESIAHLSNPQILDLFPACIVTNSGKVSFLQTRATPNTKKINKQEKSNLLSATLRRQFYRLLIMTILKCFDTTNTSISPIIMIDEIINMLEP